MRLSDYGRMSEEQRAEALRELVSKSKLPTTPENFPQLWEVLKEYEVKYGMTTAEMLARPFVDEPDYIRWAMYAELAGMR